ncbi:AMPKBI-domain-containing protein [Pseudovirgaria hyperparasitica]|uniref:AMPKBI-domain-containing protein n=1 Tax=Pseudovirgaria hyperparasitica TaxID=470096 RepID=A0A6A6W1N4_9PEZI|nr:AMPKBI-domain-containing protein [Pseudovirgaria hyperparasitica]KAF2755840.1 AMPKBI-domain-containing protein [Pseudovirgaria hyperparasitica]
MGNNTSRNSHNPPPPPPLPPPNNIIPPQSGLTSQPLFPHPPRREPQRRGSVQALSTSNSNSKAPNNVKSSAAPPSASLEVTAATFARTSVTPKTHVHARSRSHTTGNIQIPQAVRSHLPNPDSSPIPIAMGNETSREKTPREKTRRDTTVQAASPARRPSPLPAVSSQPLNVPQSNASKLSQPQNDPHATAPDKYLPPSTFHQPPRVPLPIAEELHTPGSPIITPADLSAGAPIAQIDDVPLLRNTSDLSRPDEDDESVADDFLPTEQEGRHVVNTLLEWNGEGEKVYVTGTFADWDRKFKLHPNGPSPNSNVLSTTIPLLPGTHHLKFIVDGDMQISNQLPATVDFTNSLVNYIEVSPDDPGADHTAASELSKAEGKQPVSDAHDQAVSPTSRAAYHSTSVPKNSPVAPAGLKVPEAPAHSTKPAPVVPAAPKKYHSTIPRFLLDLDAPEDSSRFARATEAMGSLPAPPTLPQFLNKSILNGQTPMKDDNSVLTYPNHTVLNHLATSSIRSNVLATSATIRYKRKFLTTIMYKPTSDDGD